METRSALYRIAIVRLADFPACLPEWNTLDSATQSIALANVIEALSYLGLGSSHSGIAFLTNLTEWRLDAGDPDRREAALLRVKLRLSIREAIGQDDIAILESKPTHQPTFIGTLVSLDTVLAPEIREQGFRKGFDPRKLFSKVIAIAKEEKSIRSEDLLYLHVVARRSGYSHDITRDFSLPSVDSLVGEILRSRRRGRFRRLAYASHCLLRLGGFYRKSFEKIHSRLETMAHSGYLQPGATVKRDHDFPKSFQSNSKLIAIYNATLLLRTVSALKPPEKYEVAQEATRTLLYKGHDFDLRAIEVARLIARTVAKASSWSEQLSKSTNENEWRDKVAWALSERGFQIQRECIRGAGRRMDIVLEVPNSNNEYCIEFKGLSRVLRTKHNQLSRQIHRYAEASRRIVILVLILDASKLSGDELCHYGALEHFIFLGSEMIGPVTTLNLTLLQSQAHTESSVTVPLVFHDMRTW